MRATLSLAALLLFGFSGVTAGQSLTPRSDYSDSYRGSQLLWKTARYADAARAPTARGTILTIDIQFGLARPHEYDPQAETVYPLVVYLHGAGARGSSLSSVLQRQTAREFAWHGQDSPLYAAFVLAAQVPAGEYWAQTRWEDGPYAQTDATYTDYMYLTDQLIAYVTDSANDTSLADALGVDANDIDTTRVYVVGDSMGAYGTWDTIGRHPGLFAAAIAASGSGPKNRLAEILETPFWTIHGIVDSLVPNALPSSQDPDGAGTLGMLGMLDPTFDNTEPTALVTLDDFRTSDDDPAPTDRLIYTEFPSNYSHGTVAMQWTTLVPGAKEWLFAHRLGGGPVEPPALIEIAPAASFEATGDGGIVLSINGTSVDDMILGTTTFANPPKHPQFPPEGADDFDLSTASSGDDQPYVRIMYDQPVKTIFIAENGAADRGYAQALDADGNPLGGTVAWGPDSYFMTGYTFLSQPGGVMVITAKNESIHGVQFLPPDEGPLSIDPMCAAALPLVPAAPPQQAALIEIAPAASFEATGDGGMVLSINGTTVDDMILGTTTFPNPPKHAQFPPEGADDFDLSTASAGDDQPYVNILYDRPVAMIFIAENGGNDRGFARALDASGNPIGGLVAWGPDSYLMTEYTFLSQPGAVMAITAKEPIYGVQFLPPDGGTLGIDPMSAPAIPSVPTTLIEIAPAVSFEATGDAGTVLSINGVGIEEMILGATAFANPPKHAQYPPEGADDFDLSTASSGDDQPYVKILYGEPVMTIFIAENGANDRGYAQALDADGNTVGDLVEWGPESYLMTEYSFLNQPGGVMVITASAPIHGVQFLPPDGGTLGIDPMSAPALPWE